MGDTFAPSQEGACLGRSVTSWTSGSGLWPACSRARRWRACAANLGSPGRPATRFSIAIKTAASARSMTAAGDRIAKRIGYRRSSRRSSCGSSGSPRGGRAEDSRGAPAASTARRPRAGGGAATSPPAATVLQQQARFDTFVQQYNRDRPHQALGMKVPADLYMRSPRAYRGLEDLTYPFHHRPGTVTRFGRICFNRRKNNLSQVFAGQNVGVPQVGERIWLVPFMDYDLGYFDDETCRLEPIENPFGPK